MGENAAWQTDADGIVRGTGKGREEAACLAQTPCIPRSTFRHPKREHKNDRPETCGAKSKERKTARKDGGEGRSGQEIPPVIARSCRSSALRIS